MKIRAPFVLAAAGMLALALAGCTNSAVGAGSTGGSSSGSSALPADCTSKSPTIGVSLPNTTNPYYIAMQKSFKDNGAQNGFTVKMAIANDSDTTQLAQVKSFIQQGVCAVALNGNNSGPAAADVKALNNAHIPVFTLNVIVDPDSLKAQNASFLQYVGPNQAEGGKQMADLALKSLGSTKKIVAGIVGDPDQIPTNQRDDGFTKALKAGNSNATVLPTVNSKVDPNIARQVTSELIQGNPDINLIFADTGPGVTGAIQAIKQAGKQGSIELYGFCAASTALTDFYKGCAAQEPADYAKTAVESIKSYLGGSKVDAQVLQPTKVFTSGQTPGDGEVG